MILVPPPHQLVVHRHRHGEAELAFRIFVADRDELIQNDLPVEFSPIMSLKDFKHVLNYRFACIQ